MQAMISTSLCKIGSTNKLMVMFDLSTTNNLDNLMTVSNRTENGVSILSVYHNSFPKLEGQADPLLHKFH